VVVLPRSDIAAPSIKAILRKGFTLGLVGLIMSVAVLTGAKAMFCLLETGMKRPPVSLVLRTREQKRTRSCLRLT